MKSFLLITTLLFFSLFAACTKTETAKSSDNRASESSTREAGVAGSSGDARGVAIDDPVDEATTRVKSPLPTPTGFVNDYAKVLDAATKKRLESTLDNLNRRSEIEFAVVTIETTGAQSSFDYTMAVARGWGVGSKAQDGGGLILLVAVKDRKWEFRWSRSLEAVLAEGVVDELERRMTGPFRQGKYAEGISSGVEAVIARLDERRVVESETGKMKGK
jgi:uncharacterized membrane protein YgcG